MQLLDKISLLDKPQKMWYEIISPVETASDELKQKIVAYTRNIIDQFPSHTNTGAYTIGNLENRPDNSIVILGTDENLEAVMNYSKKRNQLIVYGEPGSLVRGYLASLFSRLEDMFIYASGSMITELLQQHFSYKDICKNRVFHLSRAKLPNLPEMDTLHMVTVDTDSKFIEDTANFYEYANQTIDTPHSILYEGEKVVAGARANEYSPQISVIGGVHTVREHRKKGYGKLVSHMITSYLAQHSNIVALETDTENFPAQRIYEQLGFEHSSSSVASRASRSL